MRRRDVIRGGIGAAAAVPFGARAAPSPRLVVAELFTSKGCSSCPPADALLTELAGARPDILALAFHVTYWDRLGWRDPFALTAATIRQRDYARLLRLETVYTPQLVVGGRRDMIGSDRPAVLEALAAARPVRVALSVAREGGEAVITADAGQGSGALSVIGYDRQHRTAVGQGENVGRSLLETNVVRSFVPGGEWSGAPQHLRLPAPPGERLAVLLQAPDGTMLGAAREAA